MRKCPVCGKESSAVKTAFHLVDDHKWDGQDALAWLRKEVPPEPGCQCEECEWANSEQARRVTV